MAQSYKNVYFTDFPQAGARRASLTLAFGKRDRGIFEAVRHLSSDALRSALGYESFVALQGDARQRERSLNAFCLAILRKHLQGHEHSSTPRLPGLGPGSPIPLDPLQATFSGGRHEPLQDWYPYLEGYSPAFVESVIASHCPSATSVLDPFAGTGTTPLTASRLHKKAYYSEINPLLQFLTATKVVAMRLHDDDRARLVSRLSALASTFGDELDRSFPDRQLRQTYEAVFGKSEFFDDGEFEDILRCRALVDRLTCTDPLAARFLTIGVLRSLIPSSRLMRRGDLRFKTADELDRGRAGLRDGVREALGLIADDVESLARIDHVPTLLVENARNLDRTPRLSVDAVITSPPYLNGTNYFRNTKVELWFLRCLKTPEDLARFRFGSMTAGINDVTVGKAAGELPSSAVPVVTKLAANAYDVRIPRMVACFASEMHGILQTLADHTRDDGTIAIDIGDSAYAGVHVPTDEFMVESLDAAGFGLDEEIILRQRYSRSRMKLSQKLLVFRRKGARRTNAGRREKQKERWTPAWSAFKQTLPHQRDEFAKRNWGNPLHSLCSYQGKMKPSLAAHLVKAFTAPGERMLDPFSGAGTIPFEAALHGVVSWAFDICPPAVHITAGKVGQCAVSECREVVERLEVHLQTQEVRDEEIDSAGSIRFNGVLTSYFHRTTLEEVLLARRYFAENPPITPSQSLVLACLLHILHGNRPYALSRRSHPITPFAPSGEDEYRALMPRLRAKLERSWGAGRPDGFVHGQSLFQDATEWWPASVADIDAVITSPPFFDSTRFYLGNWMRLWFCGWGGKEFEERPLAFVDERQKRDFGVYGAILRQCRERLKPNGVVVFHLGASRKCDMAKELGRIAKTWFRVADVYEESVAHCERHGIRDKGTVGKHQYLVLQ